MSGGVPINRVELVYRREKAVLSPKELAEKAGVAETVVYGLEAGYFSHARPSTVRKLAAALSIKADRLVDVQRRPR